MSLNETEALNASTVPTARDLLPGDTLKSATPRPAPFKQPEALVHLDPTKDRKKTFGEVAFDTVTYAGVGLIGNELLSNEIMKSATKGEGIFKGLLTTKFEAFKGFFTKFESKPLVPNYIGEGRIAELIFATVGGTLMVIPIRALEAVKGPIARGFDRLRYGDAVDTDPQLIAAHEEMDHAPHQSWVSLGKGRIVTMLSATAADAVLGWEHSISAKLLKNTRFERVSSLDHISNEVGNAYANWRKYEGVEHAESIKNVSRLTWLFTLSATLTALFYATSKLFASKEDEKRERKREAKEAARIDTISSNDPQQASSAQESTMPTSQISEVTHAERLGTSPDQLLTRA